MKKYYITKYIIITKSVEAESASEAVKKFEADLDKLYVDGNAPALNLSFGSANEDDTVEEIVPQLMENGKSFGQFNLIGYIEGGEFVPRDEFPHA